MAWKLRTKGSKYGNKKTEFGGIKFDSDRECKRYIVLKEAEDKGIISNLEVHCKYELIPAITETITVTKQLKTKVKTEEKTHTVQQPITYTCDFRYMKDGQTIVEDVKISEYMLPKEYVLKEKMMRWKYGIQIKRVYKPSEAI